MMETNNSAQKNSGIEKRQAPRLEERNRVTATVLVSPQAPQIEHCSFHCWSCDLSETGLKFVVHTEVPIGTTLEIEVVFLDSPDNRFKHIGKVMWQQEFDEEGIIYNWLGVQFTRTLGGEDQRNAWKKIIRNRIDASNKSPTI